MRELRHDAGTWKVTVTVVCSGADSTGPLSRVLPSAGISRPRSYQLEDSPSSGVVKYGHAVWFSWLESQIERRYDATGGGLEILADILLEGFENPSYRSYLYIDHFSDTVLDDPFAGAGAQKEHLRHRLEKLAMRMGLPHPDIASSAAVLIIERTIMSARITGSSKEFQTARLLFQCLQHA